MFIYPKCEQSASEFVSGSIGTSLSKEEAITFQSLLFTVLWPILSTCHWGFNILNTDYWKEGYRKWWVEKDYLSQDKQGLRSFWLRLKSQGFSRSLPTTNWHLPLALAI